MLTNEELILVRGGGLSSTLLNSVSRFLEDIYKLGQSIGSSIRRVVSKKVCKI
jgi:hypothetical protein